MSMKVHIRPEIELAADNFLQLYRDDKPFTYLAQVILSRVPGWSDEDHHVFRRLVVRKLLKPNRSKPQFGRTTSNLGENPPDSGKSHSKESPVFGDHKMPFLPLKPNETSITESY